MNPGNRSQRLLIALFVAGQVGIFAFLQLGFEGIVLSSIILAVISASDLFSKHSLRLRPLLHTLLLVAVGAGFLAAGFARLMKGGQLTDLLVLFAEFLLVTQSLELLRDRENPVAFLPGLGTITLVLAVLAVEVPVSLRSLEWIYVGFCVCLILMLRADLLGMVFQPRLRKKAATLCLLATMAFGSGYLFQNEMRRDLGDLRQALNTIQFEERGGQLYDRSEARFVKQVGFNSLAEAKRNNPDALVFVVIASNSMQWRAPGYMRTLSFSTFDGQSWNNGVSPTSSTLDASNPIGLGPTDLDPRSTRSFALKEDYDRPLRRFRVEVPTGRGRLVPIPLNTAVLRGTPTLRSTLEVDSHANPAQGSLVNNRFEVYVEPQPNALAADAKYLETLTPLPAEDREYLKMLGDQICGEESSVKAQIALVEDFFLREFEYSLNIVPGEDLQERSELRAFLEDRRAAHCEYFATASALLLRSRGIPTRLSTGYLSYEYDDENDGFLARNRDAHAWAESFDEQSGTWRVVEATPGISTYIETVSGSTAQAFGLANAGQSLTESGSFAEALQLMFASLRNWWTNQLSQRYAWIYPVLCFGLVLLWRPLMRLLWRSRDAYRSRPVQEADRKAKRLGFVRQPHETCHHFSRRLAVSENARAQQLGLWYQQHAEQRYTNQQYAAS